MLPLRRLPDPCPQERATPVKQSHPVFVGRSIPAWAGDISQSELRTLICVDHARMCGRYKVAATLFVIGIGPSPHMRETRLGSPSFRP